MCGIHVQKVKRKIAKSQLVTVNMKNLNEGNG